MDKLNKNGIHTRTSGTLLLFSYDPDRILWMEERIPGVTHQAGWDTRKEFPICHRNAVRKSIDRRSILL